MKTKRFSLLVIVILFSGLNSSKAGKLDLWISSYNGIPIHPVRSFYMYPGGDILGLDVIYTAEPNLSLFSISSEVYRVPNLIYFNISSLYWPEGIWDPDFSDARKTADGNILLGAYSLHITGLRSNNRTVVAVGNIVAFMGYPSESKIHIRENDYYGGSWETDENYNFYVPDYGDGVRVRDIADYPLADLDSDGDVDFDDFAVFALAWKSQPGDPNWNPHCYFDFAGNLQIDEGDLVAFINEWILQRL
jgi:hypothetical protein